MKTEVSLKHHILVRFGKKSGKINKVLEGNGCAMLKLWALQNCTKSSNIVIFEKESGNIIYCCEGNGIGHTPTVIEDKGQFSNIEELAPGLLAVVNTED